MMKDRTSALPRRQRGVGLVTALFLLVVLAALGAFIVTVGTVQQVTPVLAIQGARAYQAARTGIEWGIYQAIPPSGPFSCVPSTSFTPPGTDGFTVQVQCSFNNHNEGGAAFRVFVITATATSGAFGTTDYVSRTIHATVTDAPGP